MENGDWTAFDEFWLIYPRRVAKIAARRAFEKAVRVAAPAQIFEGVRRYVQAIKDDRTELHYVAHPASWLNAGRWDDEGQLNLGEAPEQPKLVKASIAEAIEYWKAKGSARVAQSLEYAARSPGSHVETWMLMIPAKGNVVNIRKEAGQ